MVCETVQHYRWLTTFIRRISIYLQDCTIIFTVVKLTFYKNSYFLLQQVPLWQDDLNYIRGINMKSILRISVLHYGWEVQLCNWVWYTPYLLVNVSTPLPVYWRNCTDWCLTRFERPNKSVLSAVRLLSASIWTSLQVCSWWWTGLYKYADFFL